jgi:enterochelin esterase-like enzyme
VEPDSITLAVSLLVSAAAALFVLAAYRAVLVRLLAGTLAIGLAVAAGMAIVNDYYGYYRTWPQLAADLTGHYSSFAIPQPSGAVSITTPAGRIERLRFAGARSGIVRTGLVYLPPQYFQRRYARTAFPVIELLHGTPGNPWSWTAHLDVASVENKLIAERQMGPMVLVIPTMSVGRHFEECVDAPGALDDTYVTADVRTDVQARFRVSQVGAEWGVAGYSSGGYCAANLALRHRARFGASGIMDGYYRPQDGPAARALHYDAAAEALNDPLRLAEELPSAPSPLPAFWISAGTGDAADLRGAQAFIAALHGVERVPLLREPHAGHNPQAWRIALPHVLTWMWTVLAPPELRVQFPLGGSVHASVPPSSARAASHRR